MLVNLANGGFLNNQCRLSVDWDDAARTVSITVNSTVPVTKLEIDIESTKLGSIAFDCLNGPAGNVVNRGTLILYGPGSILGHTAPVNTLAWQTDIQSVSYLCTGG